ncbi:Retrovirus-related Pol polyprotein from transposon 17.6-like Protein [Tribolium castaneum]|uniref:RNA-directed DNA polymerase n=1 Tax=Tribolium castaneum TaxID=7070 RepID=D7EJT6_TRICA|nr:Retrovirus-related Pol polyprotein from transposon 17.6-like Protein [Tribolium castaneum]
MNEISGSERQAGANLGGSSGSSRTSGRQFTTQTKASSAVGVSGGSHRMMLGAHVRCFNCNITGHKASECHRPRREPGTCFECERGDHSERDCPVAANRKRTTVQAQADSTTNVIDSLSIAPYTILIHVTTKDEYIHKVFSDLINSHKVLVYLDDIIIATEDLDEYLLILREVFDLAATHKLEFRLDKCIFLNNETIYLGYLINEKGIRPNPENVKAMVEYPIPRNLKELHRFVGLASYFRRFISQFSTIAKALYDLLRKNAVFQFDADALNALETLKSKLISAPVLAIYSPSAETELHCDACAHGFKAVLTQHQGSGKFHTIFYFSQRTTDTESRYHSFELEFLAAVYAIR